MVFPTRSKVSLGLAALALIALRAHAGAYSPAVEGSVMGLSGRPMGGAAVILRYSTKVRPGFLHQVSAAADAEGRFRFTDLPADLAEARVMAHVPGKPLATASDGLPAVLTPGAPRLMIAVEPRGVLRIAFRVPEGAPPAEGAVALEKDGHWVPFAGSMAVLSDLPVPAAKPAGPGAGTEGLVGVKWHSELYGGGVFFTRLEPGLGKDTVVDLAGPDWIEGKVVDGSNQPAAGVLYRSENAFRGMASMTGKDGTFRVRRIRSGTLQIQFRDPRFRDTALVLGRDAGGPKRALLEVRLDAGSPAIRGKVAPRSGRPEACLVEARPVASRRAPAPGRSRWAGGEIRRAVPGADGSFALAGLDPETYKVRIDCPGLGPREDTASPGTALAPAAPGPARPLSGRITAAEGGAPVASFLFAASGARSETPEAALREAETLADSLGRFSIERRFEGVNHVCASAPGFAPACRAVAEGDTLPVELALERSLAIKVAVAAAGPNGDTAGLPGAKVRLRRAGSKGAAWACETGEEGTFEVTGLARGEYLLDVREGARLPYKKTVELRGDSMFTVRLAPGASLRGALRQWDGKPPRGLRVLAKPDWPAGPDCPSGIAEAPVRPDGSFVLPGLGSCPVTLGVAAAFSKSAPFLPLWRSDGRRPGGDSLDLVLPKPRTWEITVASRGSPLPADAEIHVILPALSDSVPGEALGHPLGRSSFRGSYAFAAYAGVRYVAVAAARGYRERADTVLIPPGDEPYETRIDLEPWPGLSGRLAWKEGQAAPPLAGWTARGAGSAVPLASDGSFRLEGIPPGPAPVEIRDSAGRLERAAVAVSGGEEALLPPADTLKEWPGLVVGPDGKPAAGASVILRRREFASEAGRTVSDGAGRFSWKAPAGAWLACPEEAGSPCTRLPAAPAPASPAVVRAGKAGNDNAKVTVTFKVPLPLPMRGAAVLAGPWGAAPALESREGDLLQETLTFPPLRGRLAAAAYSPSPAILYWANEAAESARLDLAPPGPGVQVTASDGEGRPLRGVTVRFVPRQGGRPWGEAEGWRPPALLLSGTDAAGGLHCLGVHPGRYWIYASHPAYACAPVSWDHSKPAAAAVSLVLKPGSPLRVKVTHGGHAAAGARVEVFDSLGNRAAPAAFGERDGDLVECGAFPPGRYQVAAAAPGLGRLVKDMEVTAGAQANVEAALPAAGWLEVTGEGLEDKSFYLKGKDNRVTSLIRQPEIPPLAADGARGGSLLFHGIAPERYEVWMEGGREGLGEVEIRPAGLTVLEVGKPVKVRVALPARRG